MNPKDRLRQDGQWRQWELERFLLGELDREKADRLERDLEDDQELRERLVSLRASNAQILAEFPPAEIARRIERRAVQPDGGADNGDSWLSRWIARGGGLALVAAAAAVVALLLWPASRVVEQGGEQGQPAVGGSEDTIRLKGLEPSLQIFRKIDGEAQRLEAGAGATAGDLIQVGYVAGGKSFGVIVSIDGRGAVTLHHPSSPSEPASIEPSGSSVLEHAYELDDAPDFERFLLVTADAPIDAANIVKAARELADTPNKARVEPLPIANELEQSSFLLEKE